MVSNDFCNIHSAKQGCSLGQHVFMCLRDQKSSTSASLPRVSVSTAMNLFPVSEHRGTKTPENYTERIKEIPHRWNVTNQHAIPHSVWKATQSHKAEKVSTLFVLHVQSLRSGVFMLQALAAILVDVNCNTVNDYLFFTEEPSAQCFFFKCIV